MNNIENGYVKLFTHHSKEAASDINKSNFEQVVLDNAERVLDTVDNIILAEINTQTATSQTNVQSNQLEMGKSLVRTLSKPGMAGETYSEPSPMIYSGNDMSANNYHENAFIDVVTLLALIALIAVVAMVCVMVFPIFS